MAKFIEPYITSSMIYAPSFNKGILFPDKALDPKTVVRLLSCLRFDALKADNSEIIIESLTYFIDVFSLAFNVNSSIFEKCTINYADHSKDFPKAVYYAFEAYSSLHMATKRGLYVANPANFPMLATKRASYVANPSGSRCTVVLKNSYRAPENTIKGARVTSFWVGFFFV